MALIKSQFVNGATWPATSDTASAMLLTHPLMLLLLLLAAMMRCHDNGTASRCSLTRS